MNRIFAGVEVGKKNIAFGAALFLVLGVAVGAPLTVDLFGGTLLTTSQYQSWKVLHGYGIFLAFINFFFGFLVDRISLTRRQKESASWSFIVAGVAGGIGRPVLSLLPVPGVIGGYTVSLIETLGFIVGTVIFLRGQGFSLSAIIDPRPSKSQEV
jgi:hypothetical protein